MTRKQLEGLTVKQLREYTKKNNTHIKYMYKMKKAELIEAIIEATKEEPTTENNNDIIVVPDMEVVEKIQLKETIEEPTGTKKGFLDSLKTWINSHKTALKITLATLIVSFMLSLVVVNLHNNNLEGFKIGYGSREHIKDNITKEGLKAITTAMQNINKHNN